MEQNGDSVRAEVFTHHQNDDIARLVVVVGGMRAPICCCHHGVVVCILPSKVRNLHMLQRVFMLFMEARKLPVAHRRARHIKGRQGKTPSPPPPTPVSKSFRQGRGMACRQGKHEIGEVVKGRKPRCGVGMLRCGTPPSHCREKYHEGKGR